jgi:hypothetical protein
MIIDGIRYAHKCDECGNGMNEGYVIEGANEHYCSDECLHKNVTPDDFQNFYIGNMDDDDDDIGDIQIYWTEWEEELAA